VPVRLIADRGDTSAKELKGGRGPHQSPLSQQCCGRPQPSQRARGRRRNAAPAGVTPQPGKVACPPGRHLHSPMPKHRRSYSEPGCDVRQRSPAVTKSSALSSSRNSISPLVLPSSNVQPAFSVRNSLIPVQV
jgi:hypothetical protein